MFKRKVKIVQISATSDNGFLFTFGLGSDGVCYIWNSQRCEWLLHKAVPDNNLPEADRPKPEAK